MILIRSRNNVRWTNCTIPLELGFEIVTGNQALTYKRSPGSAVDFEGVSTRVFLIKGS